MSPARTTRIDICIYMLLTIMQLCHIPCHDDQVFRVYLPALHLLIKAATTSYIPLPPPLESQRLPLSRSAPHPLPSSS